MPKVYIQKEKEPIFVSQEEAEKILAQKNDKNYKGMVDVGARKIQKSSIKEISFSDKTIDRTGYDLKIPEDKEKILEFEKFCEGLVVESKLDKTLDWYGFPLDQERLHGFVAHPFLGGVHWSLVQWAIDQGLIAKRSGSHEYWAIIDYGAVNFQSHDYVVKTPGYDDLVAKVDALHNLRGYRKYAQGKAIEAQASSLLSENQMPLGSPVLPQNDLFPFPTIDLGVGSPVLPQNDLFPTIDLGDGEIKPDDLPF